MNFLLLSRKIAYIVVASGFFITTSCKEPESTPAETEAPTAQIEEESIKVNPQHGQEGHRCDIPVGAPLSSAVRKAPVSTPQQSSTISPIRVNQSPVYNPPHGEPGHSCTVPVGAKL